MRARAMVLEEFSKPLTLQEIEIPELTYDGEMVIQITVAGVCGSDVYMWHGHDPRTPRPMILGHEGIGIVQQIKGEKYTLKGERLKVGDEVLWNRGVSCGRCYFCKIAKEPSLCESRWVYGIHRSCTEYPFLFGNYADTIILHPDTDLFKVPEGVSHETLVSVSCSGATAMHAFDLISPQIADRVVIQGPGPLGIYSTLLAKYSGASQIIVIGGTKKRLDLCREAGATEVIHRQETTGDKRVEQVMELTEGLGAEVVYEMAGSISAINEGLRMVRPGGSYVSAGFGEPRGTVELDCFKDIGRKNIKYQGVWVSDVSHMYRALEITLRHKDLFSSMVTHRYQLEEATQALEKMESKEAIKVVMKP